VPVKSTKRQRTTLTPSLRIDIDLEQAEREAARVRQWLIALRQRHDLSRFEYTHHIRVVPASPTYSHPILTLGTRFTETEDKLLATYLHEQMHWYLYLLGGPDHDPIAPFFDELVRRYPDAPTQLPEGARNYDQTYAHLVINYLELCATGEIIGHARAAALAETQFGYRWIYRTVIRDWDKLGALLKEHGILPIQPAHKLLAQKAKNGFKLNLDKKPSRKTTKKVAKTNGSAMKNGGVIKAHGVPQKKRAAKLPPPTRKSRRSIRARGDRSAG
jgi:hypothetical protein